MNAAGKAFHETTTRVSLRVPKKTGETTLRLLAHLNLLDVRSKIKRDEEMLLLPLLRKPSSAEASDLRNQIGEVTIGQDKFEPKTRSVLSLEETLEGLLSPSQAASLPASFDIVGDIAVVEFPQELSEFW